MKGWGRATERRSSRTGANRRGTRLTRWELIVLLIGNGIINQVLEEKNVQTLAQNKIVLVNRQGATSLKNTKAYG